MRKFRGILDKEKSHRKNKKQIDKEKKWDWPAPNCGALEQESGCSWQHPWLTLFLELPLYKFRAMWITSYCKGRVSAPTCNRCEYSTFEFVWILQSKTEVQREARKWMQGTLKGVISSAKIYCIHAMGERGFDKLINLTQVFLPLKSCLHSQTASLPEVGRDSAQRASRHSDTVTLYFKVMGREIERCILLGQNGIPAERGHV